MKEKLKKLKSNKLFIVILINLTIFSLVNIIFNIKYEQVDDFIIYNLYSGLDGTYNLHGIYIHPVICMILSALFRIIPTINWHTIFLLIMQFICFTIIGNRILRKNNSKKEIIIYILFASVFYTSLLLLIQYTSVSALLILTAFFMLVDDFERNINKRSSTILNCILFAIGIMTRMQSLLIIVPFFILYALYYITKWIKKDIETKRILDLLKKYIILALLTILVYISNIIIYQSNDLYKEYMEYNNVRAILHDMSYTSYKENKEIFDEIGWSENDHYLFYTFNFGEEKIYSKENLEKILNYKISKNEYFNLNLKFKQIEGQLLDEMKNTNTYISILFISIFFTSIIMNKEKTKFSVAIFLTTIGVNILFIILNRSMLRVVIPEYILGTALLIYFTKLKAEKEEKIKERDLIISILIIFFAIIFAGDKYEFGYAVKDYEQYQNVIEYTNSHKENVYLYTVPSLQFRYLAYSVYKMPEKGAFSNLRVMGGWDMFTKNYYDFKERYNLEGTFLDVLKENVYLIDGDVIWSGNRYHNYIENIVKFIQEHYKKEVEYKKIEEFDNIYIYKITEKN